jgi:hypothetical protein
VPNRERSWPGMRDGLLVVGVMTLVLSLSALAASVVTPDPLLVQMTENVPRQRGGTVLGTQRDFGPVACHYPCPTSEPDREVAHQLVQAAGPTAIPIGDGDRRRDLIIMSAMVRRGQVATALTLLPYQLSLSPVVSPAGVAMPAYRQ